MHEADEAEPRGTKGRVVMPVAGHVRKLRAAVGSELLLVPSVAAVIRDADGRILLHRRRDDGLWSLPAGAIEIGETPVEAVIRETLEETGWEVRPLRLLGAFGGSTFRHTYPNGDRVEYTVVVYECEITGAARRAHGSETLEVRYFQPAEMPPLSLPYPAELFGGTSGAPVA